MIKIKNITIKNFMSVGNVTQAVNFQESGLTLVLGNNLDLGGDGSRNGVGKTTLINALSYALYGQAITKIRQNNLINKTNSKGMLVTVEFEVNGDLYRIERGRSPNVFRFLVNELDAVQETDEGQGEMRLTQKEVETVIGLNHIMFKHIIALNTYNEPFLALRANDQRDIIEHLLGITMLSEKATVLKDLLKETKDAIKEEEYRIKGIENANTQIQKSIEDLVRRQKVWAKKNEETVSRLESQIHELEAFDIEAELEAHVALDEYRTRRDAETSLQKDIASCEAIIQREERQRATIKQDLKATQEHRCYACGGEVHDEQHKSLLESKTLALKECNEAIDKSNVQLKLLVSELEELGPVGEPAKTKYQTAQEAYEHQSQLSSLRDKLDAERHAEDPYKEQVEHLNNSGLQQISWDAINNLHSLREHQDFLLKLLTNKDSFIRKRIIEQNLQYLNSRLNYYLTKLGLPHEVVFQSDLNVEITELGRELDFDNLSRGERNRLILGLSWAFRDVHESMNTPIDFMAIDELIDSGMDSNGVESALTVLKKMHRDRNKNIFLISHREELIGRVNNTLYVVKENGFTGFSTEQEFDIE
jgi:DNA repair exonuclease SbcCD ATPase subunit